MSSLTKIVGLNRIVANLFAVTSMDILIMTDDSLKEVSPVLLASLINFRAGRDELFRALNAVILVAIEQRKNLSDVAATDDGEALQEQLTKLTFGKM